MAPPAGEESGNQVLELDRAELADRMIGKTLVPSAANWLRCELAQPSPTWSQSCSAGSSTPVGTSMTGSTWVRPRATGPAATFVSPLKARYRSPHVRAPSSVKRPTVLHGLRCASYSQIKAFRLRFERHTVTQVGVAGAALLGPPRVHPRHVGARSGKRFGSIAGNDHAVHLEAAGTAGGDCRAGWWMNVRWVTRYQLGLARHAGQLTAPLRASTPQGTCESAGRRIGDERVDGFALVRCERGDVHERL